MDHIPDFRIEDYPGWLFWFTTVAAPCGVPFKIGSQGVAYPIMSLWVAKARKGQHWIAVLADGVEEMLLALHDQIRECEASEV